MRIVRHDLKLREVLVHGPLKLYIMEAVTIVKKDLQNTSDNKYIYSNTI